ncbi:MAG: RagB/SusD family nutrient uptake outer membrane protein [Acidobacterium ailaaui]|nr:RagB/SusD family nutrient uptake outer membrane protein [Pseudacidobacterium ailaaui]
MKKNILFILLLAVGLVSSCKKSFLDQQPLSQLSPASSFGSSDQLQLYVNSFYNDILPSATDIYANTTDNIVTTQLSPQLTGNRTVPVSGGGWSWGALRNINFFLQNYSLGGLPSNITAPYVAAARFFRAYFYFKMVQQFGDVPWYSKVIDANDSLLLLKPRDSRMLIIDSILTDLNFAIDNLPTQKSVDRITKWTALALKSRVCLFEGTWRKYHANDVFGKDSYGNPLTGADSLLQACVDASRTLMNSGQYTIYTSTPNQAYAELFNSPNPISSEVILARTFSADLQVFHNVNYYTLSPSYGKPGLNQELVNTYLMADGSSFTQVPGYDTMQFYSSVQHRDPRLLQTVRGPGYTRLGSNKKLAPDFGATVTGYQLTKFVGPPSQDPYNMSLTPLPIFRYAEVLLNYAEAKAELGTLTQDDIDKSIKLLRDRVGMPNLNMTYANAHPDSYLEGEYPNVSGGNKGVILEIRRERRIELVMEGFRWNDLMRWKAGALLAKQFYGEYFPGPGSFDLDGDGNPDVVIYTGSQPPTQQGVVYLKLGSDITLSNGNSGHIIVNGNITKTFREDRDYLNPLPTQELLLNPKLTQNPNW